MHHPAEWQGPSATYYQLKGKAPKIHLLLVTVFGELLPICQIPASMRRVSPPGAASESPGGFAVTDRPSHVQSFRFRRSRWGREFAFLASSQVMGTSGDKPLAVSGLGDTGDLYPHAVPHGTLVV